MGGQTVFHSEREWSWCLSEGASIKPSTKTIKKVLISQIQESGEIPNCQLISLSHSTLLQK